MPYGRGFQTFCVCGPLFVIKIFHGPPHNTHFYDITYYNQAYYIYNRHYNRLITIAMEYEIYTAIRTLGYSLHFKTFSDFRGLLMLILRVLQVLKK